MGKRMFTESGSDLNKARKLLLTEAITAFNLTILKAYSAQVHSFIGIVQDLNWSNHRISRIIRLLAKIESLKVASAIPAVCNDARKWAASGYSALPRTVTGPYIWEVADTQLEGEIRVLGYHVVDPGTVILGLLSHYLTVNDRLIVTKVGNMERNVSKAETRISFPAIIQIEQIM